MSTVEATRSTQDHLSAWLRDWQFADHPFRLSSSEKEGTRLGEYFLEPGFWHDVMSVDDSHVIVATWGAGKTAIRLRLQAELALSPGTMVVVIDDLNTLDALPDVTALEVANYLAAEVVATILSDTRSPITSINREQGHALYDAVSRHARQYEFERRLRYLERSYVFRNGDSRWTRAKWWWRRWRLERGHSLEVKREAELGGGAKTFGRYGDVARFVVEAAHEAAAKLPPHRLAEVESCLSDVLRLVQLFGFERIVFLVDGIDDLADGAFKDYHRMARLLLPMVVLAVNHQRETLAISYKIHAPKEVVARLAFRRDKLRTYPIKWPDDRMVEAIGRRLEAHSGGRITHLRELIFSRSDRDELVEMLLCYSAGIPRTLIEMLNGAVSDHCERKTQQRYLTRQDLQAGIRRYWDTMSGPGQEEYVKAQRARAVINLKNKFGARAERFTVRHDDWVVDEVLDDLRETAEEE